MTNRYPWQFRPRHKIKGEEDGLNNGERAQRAAETVSAHNQTPCGGDERESSIQDLLSDILHLCDREKLDFDDIVERARRQYWEER